MLSNLLKVCTVSLLIVTTGSSIAARETTAPDILLIAGDDLGVYLGCYGDPYAKTPHMDRLAQEGVLFENAWVTQASCSPSRSSILTGLYPHQNNQIGLAHHGFSMSGEFGSIPSLLNEAGYYTGLLRKLHVNPESSFPFQFHDTLKGNAGRDPEAYAAATDEFLEKAGDKPFFLFASFVDPHRPFPPQVNGYPKEPVEADDVKLLPFLEGLEDVPGLQEDVAGYYNAVMRLDAGVGLVMEKLKAAGRADNLLIIFIGDHGAPFGRGKVTAYHPSLHVPFIVKWPGVSKTGAKSTALVSTIDILPTMLDAAGIEYKKKLPGISLRQTVAEPSHDPREYMFGEFTVHLPVDYYPRRTVRNKQYQLIHNLMSEKPNPVAGIEGRAERAAITNTDAGTSRAREAIQRYMHPPEFELFDLQKDPDSFANLAGRPEYKKVQDELFDELMKWRRESDDPLLKEGEMERVGQMIDETLDTSYTGADQPKSPKKTKSY